MEKETKIVFVDDDKTTLTWFKEYLKKTGYNDVEVFSTGQSFLEYFEMDTNDAPGIVFLDMNLPDITGGEVFDKARRQDIFSHTIFVSLSKYMQMSDKDWLENYGFHDVISKPIDEQGLLDKIKMLIDEREHSKSTRKEIQNPEELYKELIKLRIRHRVLEKNYTEKLISPYLYNKIKKSPQDVTPDMKKISVGFVDIRGSTKLIKEFTPEDMSCALNLFFRFVCRSVEETGGVIERFTGDGLMWFHEGGSIKENSERCINTAIKMIQGLDKLNEEIGEEIKEDGLIKIGIGAACGKSFVGFVGDQEHQIQYTAIGRVVNLAARLCEKAPPNQIIIGGKIIDHCKYPFEDFEEKIDDFPTTRKKRLIIPKG